MFIYKNSVALFNENCLHVCQRMDANTLTAIITDPPYGLSFMGKNWDKAIPGKEFWCEFLRVSKPGAILLAFGGTKTFHRLMCAIEDGGWELRDTIMWVYGTGFPKSMDVAKSIDNSLGVEREVVGQYDNTYGINKSRIEQGYRENTVTPGDRTMPTSEEAKKWFGYGTALKPAWEPIIVAMKQPDKTFANNAIVHGVGGFNIDRCRIKTDDRVVVPQPMGGSGEIYGFKNGKGRNGGFYAMPKDGRFPSNLIHDGSEEVVNLFPFSSSGAMNKQYTYTNTGYSMGKPSGKTKSLHSTSSGSAARFFYCAKASKAEKTNNGTIVNNHPTVKPLGLMEYLCRLVKQPGENIILDPFMGSGTTIMAGYKDGITCIGCENDVDSFRIGEERIRRYIAENSQTSLL